PSVVRAEATQHAGSTAGAVARPQLLAARSPVDEVEAPRRRRQPDEIALGELDEGRRAGGGTVRDDDAPAGDVVGAAAEGKRIVADRAPRIGNTQPFRALRGAVRRPRDPVAVAEEHAIADPDAAEKIERSGKRRGEQDRAGAGPVGGPYGCLVVDAEEQPPSDRTDHLGVGEEGAHDDARD